MQGKLCVNLFDLVLFSFFFSFEGVKHIIWTINSCVELCFWYLCCYEF